MKIPPHHFFIFHFILILPFLPQNSAQFSFMYEKCGNTIYPTNSTYQKNLNQVLNSLSTNTQITYGFYNFTAGQEPDRVEAIVLCRGDLPLDTCRVCVRDSAATLPLNCPNNKQAFGYTENCIIFYTNKTIFHKSLLAPGYTLANNDNATSLPGLDQLNDLKGLNHSIYSLFDSLQNKAANGNSQLKFATGEAHIIANRSVYGMVQCNPDLSRLDCLHCVQGLLTLFPQHIILPDYIAAGERSMSPSCNIRYEFFKFYNNVVGLASSPHQVAPNTSVTVTSTKVGKSNKSHASRIVAISIAGALAVLIIAFICVLLWRRKHSKPSTRFSKEEIDTLKSLQYSFGVIKAATGDFSSDNKLGKGGFGAVYKGKLPNGQEIAVKRLLKNSVQGNEQFKNEVLLLAKLQHRDLVRLLGFCLEEEEVILIYEFIVNGSLDNLVFDPVHRASMTWETRFKIIRGIARGVLYLHEDSRLRIIHRDLKAGNVLLDADFNPKIADFGMARLFNIDQTQAVASKIVGTYGYMPPVYLLHGHVSMKLDVYSFGVLVLEIISGQRISSFKIGEDPENLLIFAWKNWVEGTPWNLVDPNLSSAFSTEILRCIHIGLLCVQQNLADRPTMSSVVHMLSRFSISLQPPTQPASFARDHTPSKENGVHQSSNGGLVECSLNEVTITGPYPR